MVDFRYHIVSIVAVFLALGIGIIIGTTTLDKPLLDDLKRNVQRLSSEKQERNDRISELEETVSDDRAFAQAVAPLLVGGQLQGRNVLVVSAPGVDNDVRDGVLDILHLAEATVTGRVRLTDELGKQERAKELDDLVNRLLPAGVQLTGTTAAQRAASELASVLGVRTSGAPPPSTPPPGTTRVLSGLAENDFVDVDGPVDKVVPAPLVLVLVPETVRKTATPSPLTPEADPVLAFVNALTTRAQGVVVAAPASAAGGTVLGAIRSDSLLAGRLSTVDSADGAPGRIGTVLALGNELVGEHGHYGAGSGADAPVPSPAPAARP